MDKTKILKVAMEQSAEDLGCLASDFLKDENVIVPFKLGRSARKYLKLPIPANLVSYGSNVVAGVTPEVEDIVREYIGKFEYYHLFETPNMNWLTDRLAPLGYKCCFMAEYFLPGELAGIKCPYTTRVLTHADFEPLYGDPSWSNAICESRKELDVLGVGAYDGDRLIGLAACSADCDTMWQIGVDVLPSYRRQGIASALTSALAKEILARDKVPFYCCAWSNIRSARNAIRAGFIPSWAEFTIKPSSVIDEMNR